MTYKEIKRQIKILEGLRADAKKEIAGYRTDEIYTQVGFHDYMPTGKYEVVPEYTYVQPACNLKIDKEIERLMRLPEYQVGKAEEEKKKTCSFYQAESQKIQE